MASRAASELLNLCEGQEGMSLTEVRYVERRAQIRTGESESSCACPVEMLIKQLNWGDWRPLSQKLLFIGINQLEKKKLN